MLDLVLALAVVVVCDGCGDCDERSTVVELEPAGPGTAAVHVKGTSARNAFVMARWRGTATNRGSEPCRMALYEHASAPDAAAVPVLGRSEAAPRTTADGGVLVFESVLPGSRDGQVFVRELDMDALGDDWNGGTPLEPEDGDDDEALRNIDVWMTVATCVGPQIEVKLEIVAGLCPKLGADAVAVDRWWPEGQGS